MAWITPLVIGGSSLLGSAMSSNASGNAAQDIENASALSSATQLGMYGQTRADLLPFMTSGNAALSNLDALMGIKPTAANAPTDTLGQLTTDINNRAFGPGPTSSKRGILSELSDPANISGSHQTQLNDLFLGGAGNPIPGLKDLAHLKDGGPAGGPGTFVVGERGPELLHMAPGSKGYVEPNSPKANVAAYGRSGIPGRLYGGPVAARTGDPLPFMPSMGGPIVNRFSGPMGPRTGDPVSSPYMGGFRAPMAYDSPLGYRPGMPMIQRRAGGGPVEGFDPTAGNNTPLPGSGQTPADIMAQAPEYQFVEQQGLQGLDASAAAQGNLFGGGHIKDILNYSQGLASQQYQNIFNNLQAVTALGESAGAMVGNSGTYAGMGMGNSIMAGGNAAASGAVGSSNAFSSGLGNLGFMYAMNPGMFGGSSTPGKSTSNG